MRLESPPYEGNVFLITNSRPLYERRGSLRHVLPDRSLRDHLKYLFQSRRAFRRHSGNTYQAVKRELDEKLASNPGIQRKLHSRVLRRPTFTIALKKVHHRKENLWKRSRISFSSFFFLFFSFNRFTIDASIR